MAKATKKKAAVKSVKKPISAAKPVIKPAAKPATKVTAKKVASKKKPATEYKVGEGSKAPSFEGTATSGKSLSLKDFAKKTLVLYFYPKDNTPGCTLEGQDFRKLHKKFLAAGAEIIGVSQDSIASHEKFKSKCDFPFELLSDELGETCKAFDVMQMKSMYGREFMGIERSTFVIKGEKILKEWRKVKVNGHAQEVLDFVESLK